MKRGTCAFCGTKDTWINSEHVIPRWAAQTVLDMMSAPYVTLSRGNEIVHQSSKHIAALNIEAYCACRDKCNNVWMHQLEDDVIPFMRSMIATETLTLLDNKRRALLTAWTIKTAMTHECFGPRSERFFRFEERFELMMSLMPPMANLHVWVGASAFVSQAHSFPILLNNAFGYRAPTFYALTLSLGHLVLQLLAYRGSEWENGKLLNIASAPFSDRLLWLTAPDDPARLLKWPSVAITEDERPDFEHRFFPRLSQKRFLSNGPRPAPNRKRTR